jgi:hypothetical protein
VACLVLSLSPGAIVLQTPGLSKVCDASVAECRVPLTVELLLTVLEGEACAVPLPV